MARVVLFFVFLVCLTHAPASYAQDFSGIPYPKVCSSENYCSRLQAAVIAANRRCNGEPVCLKRVIALNQYAYGALLAPDGWVEKYHATPLLLAARINMYDFDRARVATNFFEYLSYEKQEVIYAEAKKTANLVIIALGLVNPL